MEQMRVYEEKGNDNEEGKTERKISIIDWVFTCFDEKTGGFGGNTGQDAHLLYTLSAIQILALADRLHDERLQTNRVVDFVASLQQPDGSFCGDHWGEIDTRFTYCALSTLSLLNKIDAVDADNASSYIMKCRNIDGGFGCVMGAESHAGKLNSFYIMYSLGYCQMMNFNHTYRCFTGCPPSSRSSVLLHRSSCDRETSAPSVGDTN